MTRHSVSAVLISGAAFVTACTTPASIVLEPLRIINISPAGGAFCIAPDATIHVTFSAPLVEATITDDAIYLLDAGGKIPTTQSYHLESYTVGLDPVAPLGFETLYTLVATQDLHSAEKGRLPVAVEASFLTVARLGCVPGVECSLPSDCEGPEKCPDSDTCICANIGVCVPECVTDNDCFRGTCNAGTCIPDAAPDGGNPAGDPGGDPSAAGDPGGDPSAAGDPGGDPSAAGDPGGDPSAAGDPGGDPSAAGDPCGDPA